MNLPSTSPTTVTTWPFFNWAKASWSLFRKLETALFSGAERFPERLAIGECQV